MVLTTEGKLYGDVFFSIPYTLESREALRQIFIIQPVASKVRVEAQDHRNV